MSSLDTMRTRLDYAGGIPQQSRMIRDKLKTLKKAYLYSYQGGTTIIIPKDDEELRFRCLMNPDKITFEANKMMLSIPFEDVCLNGSDPDEIIKVPISCGDTFIWEETNTRWIVTLQHLTELAYFRADVRKCFPHPLDVEGEQYWFASIGENEEIIEWNKHNLQEWNKLNYTRTLYLKRNEQTLNYFKRFKVIKVPNIQGELESWEVQAVSPNSTDDILIIHIKEYFENRFDDLNVEIQNEQQENYELNEDLVTYPFEQICITVKEIADAKFNIKNETKGLQFEIRVQKNNDGTLTLFINLLTGNTGSFDITYNDIIIRHVVIKSF